MLTRGRFGTGLRWWEFDMTYCLIRVRGLMRLVNQIRFRAIGERQAKQILPFPALHCK
jgi:hypothetical protein